MFVANAFHLATQVHTDHMLAFSPPVLPRSEGARGLLEFKACREVSRNVLAGYSRWESRAEFEAALATITSLAPERDPAWTDQPDEVIMLEVP